MLSFTMPPPPRLMVPHGWSSQGPEAFHLPFFSILPDVCILPLLRPYPLEGAVLPPTLPYLNSLFLFVLSTLMTTEVTSLYLLLVTAYFPPFKTTSIEVYQFISPVPKSASGTGVFFSF